MAFLPLLTTCFKPGWKTWRATLISLKRFASITSNSTSGFHSYIAMAVIIGSAPKVAGSPAAQPASFHGFLPIRMNKTFKTDAPTTGCINSFE